MELTRRAALSTALATTLSGCSTLGGNGNSVDWSAPFEGDYIAQKPYLGHKYVAVATDDGGIGLLSADSGNSVASTRRNLSNAAGTPPVPIADSFLTVTDHVVLLHPSGELRWSQALPDGGYASIQSRPIVIDGSAFVTTSESYVYRIDVRDREIHRVGDLTVPGRWWNRDGRQVVVGTRSLETALFDLDSGKERWTTFSNMVAHPFLYESDVVTSVYRNGSLELVCIDPDGDTERWSRTLPGSVVSFAGLVSDDLLAVVTGEPWERDKQGQVSLVKPKTGEVVATNDLPPRVNAPGDIRGSTLFLTSYDGTVLSIDPNRGKRVEYEHDGHITSPPAVRDGNLVFGTDEPKLYSIQLD
ncbi:hypothetical protein A4G99_18335 [Haladaptatus sp. R4]|uniref:outer membrane protein assembly factor BamB family protein n=1 Tax=Haladaptatus sp. R4 TaxID=1679489 RepID=UPI0007B4E668|nr:PQQ-binding-like beta-propeller repeat protein [Haladaptatus sp. R4]KZN22717.1 hypothetical protein A4G99_18335 [Haladaptatus sp. R4]